MDQLLNVVALLLNVDMDSVTEMINVDARAVALTMDFPLALQTTLITPATRPLCYHLLLQLLPIPHSLSTVSLRLRLTFTL